MVAHNAESARGVSPRAAHRSGRESLDSSGSCHPPKAAAFCQRKEFLRWVCQVFCVNNLDFVLGFGSVVAPGFAVVVGFGDGVQGKGAWSAPLG